MATNTELVQQLYVAYFNRPADVAGLEYYVGLLDSATDVAATVKVISKDFANATEYKAIYGSLSAEATINAIYHNLFGHEADIPGLKYWADLYKSGTVTLATVVADVAAGAQTTDATAFANKVTAAAAFTDAISLSADQKLAYAAHTDAAIAVAQAYLAGVTDDASLTAALADVSTTAAGVVPSTASTLTVGVDTLTGTSANDVYNTLVLDAGVAQKTLNAGDVIDGGAGTNTVNVTNSGAGLNDSIVGTFKNIQIFNIDNTGGAAAAVTGADTSVDVSKLGTAVKQVWQVSKATGVTNLGTSTTAGFKGTDSTGAALTVAATSTATSATLAVKDVVDASEFSVSGTKLATVNVSGNAVDADGEAGGIKLAVVAGSGVQTVTVNSGLTTDLSVSNAGGKVVTSVNLAGSTGDITYTGSADVATIKGGSGDDVLTIKTATVAAASGVTAVTANIDGGAGDNNITVATSGTGLTNVTTGAGDDTVEITQRGDGKLTVSLGAGNDTFLSSTDILATDSIDAGAGTDTLLLSLVGANNIGAFSNFDVFDAKDLASALDVNILADKNTVTEFVTSAAVGAGAELDNIGAGIGYRITGGDDLTNAITLNQATAGAITLTVDADESGTTAKEDVSYAGAVVTNATSVKAVFDTAFVGDATSNDDNLASLKVSTAAATSVTVVSGGTNATNVLALADTAATTAKLASITITGSSLLELSLTNTGASSLATIDASASTGGLTYNVSSLKLGGTIKLGSGADTITATAAGSNAAKLDSLVGFEKAAAAAVGTDAEAAADAIAAADVVVVASAVVADDAKAGTLTNTTDSITDGVLTFGGSGPATLAAAIARAQADVTAANDTVVFKYLGDTYIFAQGATTATTDDVVVKLTGVTGVTALGVDADNAGHLFIV